MTPRFILCAALSAGLALPLGAAPVLAQGATLAASPAGMTNPSSDVEAHIASLRAELGITPAQVPEWDTFATVMRQNAAGIQQLYQSRLQNAAPMNAVETLTSYRDFARMHLADLDTLVPAFTKLYAVLSPDQQETADALFQNRAAAAAAG
jgi:LTXXQ motif family protein